MIINAIDTSRVYTCPNCGASCLHALVEVPISQTPDGDWEVDEQDITSTFNHAQSRDEVFVRCANPMCSCGPVLDQHGAPIRMLPSGPVATWCAIYGHPPVRDEMDLDPEQLVAYHAWWHSLIRTPWEGYLTDADHH